MNSNAVEVRGTNGKHCYNNVLSLILGRFTIILKLTAQYWF
jgi:hypothetical protein